jgi:hypothetical protein
MINGKAAIRVGDTNSATDVCSQNHMFVTEDLRTEGRIARGAINLCAG